MPLPLNPRTYASFTLILRPKPKDSIKAPDLVKCAKLDGKEDLGCPTQAGTLPLPLRLRLLLLLLLLPLLLLLLLPPLLRL